MLATRFDKRHASETGSDHPLSDAEMKAAVPSVFAPGKAASRSERYTYIPTIEVLEGLRREGFEPLGTRPDAGIHPHAGRCGPGERTGRSSGTSAGLRRTRGVTPCSGITAANAARSSGSRTRCSQSRSAIAPPARSAKGYAVYAQKRR
jgi:hypothetical protein